MKLRVLPEKQTYAPHEKIRLKAEFTNRSDRPLCFPKPDLECVNSVAGYVAVEASAPGNPRDRHEFVCVVDDLAPAPEELPREIKRNWIKVPVGQVYAMEFKTTRAQLDSPGQWRLQATYHPPTGASYDPRKSKRDMDLAARKAGCLVPATSVPADPVLVEIAPPR